MFTKYWVIIVFTLVYLFFPSKIFAQSYSYDVNSFQSIIELQKDTSLAITETISVNFTYPKHGIFRVIPTYYTSGAKTINSKVSVKSVKNENGVDLEYQTSRLKQSVKIKIGDPDVTIVGNQTYVIKYEVYGIVLTYDGSPEIYWNVAGSEWDTDIENVVATVHSPFAEIVKVDCYSGRRGSMTNDCDFSHDENSAEFSSKSVMSPGEDLTIVVGLNSSNQLSYPSTLEKIANYIFDNWGYVVSVIPFLIIVYFWYRRGRDTRFVSDNVYYQPDDKKERGVALFERKLIPLVYHPVNNLTPAEVGTLIDEKVDIQDVIAEIVELARLGFLKIEKFEGRGLFKKPDYGFEKIEKKDIEKNILKKHQKLILDKLFDDKIIKASTKGLGAIKNSSGRQRAEKLLNAGRYVLLSSMKNNFYTSLSELKRSLYEEMTKDRLFNENPEKIRIKWISLSIVINALAFFGLLYFYNITANLGPFLPLTLFAIPVIFLSLSMPKRTAWGYSLFMQVTGLKNYLKLGKWREEIYEKHLFLEEMLPLAVSLGVVEKLAKDMKELGVPPPKYFSGTSVNSFASDFTKFNTYSSGSLVSSPQSGRSSWSGGSGFGGGSSGGGFGGGGGGSW